MFGVAVISASPNRHDRPVDFYRTPVERFDGLPAFAFEPH
jgi:hypothetical protein